MANFYLTLTWQIWKMTHKKSLSDLRYPPRQWGYETGCPQSPLFCLNNCPLTSVPDREWGYIHPFLLLLYYSGTFHVPVCHSVILPVMYFFTFLSQAFIYNCLMIGHMCFCHPSWNMSFLNLGTISYHPVTLMSSMVPGPLWGLSSCLLIVWRNELMSNNMKLSILFVNFLTLILLSFFGWCVLFQNIWCIAGVRAHVQRNRYIVRAYMCDGTLALTRNWRKHIRLLIEKVICSLPSVSAWQFHSYLQDFSGRRWWKGLLGQESDHPILVMIPLGDAIWDLHRARLTLLMCPPQAWRFTAGVNAALTQKYAFVLCLNTVLWGHSMLLICETGSRLLGRQRGRLKLNR